MKNYYCIGGVKTPFILFDIYNQIFEVVGVATNKHWRLTPEAVGWLQKHQTSIPKNATFKFKLKKYNQHGIKALIPLLKEIQKIEGVNIEWHCYQSAYLPWRLRWGKFRLTKIKVLLDSNEHKIETLIDTQSEENIELAIQLLKACKMDYVPYVYRALIEGCLNWSIQQRFEECYFFSLPFYKKDKLQVPASGITFVPFQIEQMPHLTTLDLSYNPIKQLPTSIAKLTNLKVLDISNTQIEELPEEIAQLTSLEEIHLKNTRINCFSSGLLSLPQLKVITLNEHLKQQLENDDQILKKFYNADNIRFQGVLPVPEFIKSPPHTTLAPIYFAGTEDAPQVTLDKDKGIFEIIGNSFMDNPDEFYQVVIDWLDHYVNDLSIHGGLFVFRFGWIDPEGASVPWVKKIMQKLEYLKDVCIRWCFHEEDEDLEEMMRSFYIESNVEYVVC